MASRGSKKVIYAALTGNLLIAIAKLLAAWITGSSAMLSEAVHSLVDTGNQGLMLHGMRQAAKPPTSEHPFGHGLQLYFWTFIVAILIFGLGAGIALVEGINKILIPHPLESPAVNYAVLAVSAVFPMAGCRPVQQGSHGIHCAVRGHGCLARPAVSGSRTSHRAGIQSAGHGRGCLGRHRYPACGHRWFPCLREPEPAYRRRRSA